ncbi:hypothetical protein [uncultured Nostoc sp.]
MTYASVTKNQGFGLGIGDRAWKIHRCPIPYAQLNEIIVLRKS